jgi:DSBA-like thioredoxin domain
MSAPPGIYRGDLAFQSDLGGLWSLSRILIFSCQALSFLKSDDCLEKVNNQVAEARAKGVTGVPFTIIDGKWAVSGGQSAPVFVKVRIVTTDYSLMVLTDKYSRFSASWQKRLLCHHRSPVHQFPPQLLQWHDCVVPSLAMHFSAHSSYSSHPPRSQRYIRIRTCCFM